MQDPLKNFNWPSLNGDYDALCTRFDRTSEYLHSLEPRPRSDRELYDRLVSWTATEMASGEGISLELYGAITYWKLYSQPAAVNNICRRISQVSVLQAEIRLGLAKLSETLSASIPRDLSYVISLVRRIGDYVIHGMIDAKALPMRTTFLHFIYPDVVPVFDKMVLQAVGIKNDNANKKICYLKQYIPFAWELADKYAFNCAAFPGLTSIRLVDMALWVTRGGGTQCG